MRSKYDTVENLENTLRKLEGLKLKAFNKLASGVDESRYYGLLKLMRKFEQKEINTQLQISKLNKGI